MAEPAVKATLLDDQPDEFPVVHRWVRGADGRMELLELPLTPELFLDPQIGDQVVQTNLHFDLASMLCEMIRRHLQAKRQDVLVMGDVKHVWRARDRRGPAPDVSVVLGVENPGRVRESFNLANEGVLPCLIIEIVSSSNPKIRKSDLVDKVELYQRVGIPEYLLIDPPGPETAGRFQLIFHRLAATGRYRRVAPNEEGRLISETTGIAFATSQDGQDVLLFDAATGQRLLTSSEVVAKAADEAKLRKEAEAEVARLRAELARLKR